MRDSCPRKLEGKCMDMDMDMEIMDMDDFEF
jgi:hypothetical protein